MEKSELSSQGSIADEQAIERSSLPEAIASAVGKAYQSAELGR